MCNREMKDDANLWQEVSSAGVPHSSDAEPALA